MGWKPAWGRSKPGQHEAGRPSLWDDFGVGARLHDPALVEPVEQVAARHGREPMGDDDQRLRAVEGIDGQKEYNDKATGRGLSKFTSENAFSLFVDREVLTKGYANQEKGKAVFRADPVEDDDAE